MERAHKQAKGAIWTLILFTLIFFAWQVARSQVIYKVSRKPAVEKAEGITHDSGSFQVTAGEPTVKCYVNLEWACKDKLFTGLKVSCSEPLLEKDIDSLCKDVRSNYIQAQKGAAKWHTSPAH